MADRVVRLQDVYEVTHATRNDNVVLLVTGCIGKKKVRLEIPFHPYNIDEPVKQLRAGTDTQVAMWTRAKESLK